MDVGDDGGAVRVGGGTVERGVFAGIALFVSAMTVLTVARAVSVSSASLAVGVGGLLPQDASMAARNKRINILPKMFTLPLPLIFYEETLGILL